jgi:hypothetical protein
MPILYFHVPHDVFVFPSEVELLRPWLEETLHFKMHRLVHPPEEWRDKGINLLGFGGIEWYESRPGVTTGKVEFRSWLEDEGRGLIPDANFDLRDVMTFKLMQIDRNRVELHTQWDSSIARELYEQLVTEIEARWPDSRIVSTTGELTPSAVRSMMRHPDEGARRRGGGPEPPTLEEKIRMVARWFKIRGKRAQTQEGYCADIGIAPSTLRSYIRELRELGKLPKESA